MRNLLKGYLAVTIVVLAASAVLWTGLAVAHFLGPKAFAVATAFFIISVFAFLVKFELDHDGV